MSEKAFENKIKNYLKTLPNTWHFKVWGGGFQQAGIPDIIACVNGRFVAIEVKDINGRPSPLQVHKVDSINASGGYAVIAYPKDWEQLKADLDRIAGV